MRPWKLRILLCVVFLVIVSLVALAITYRTTPRLPAVELPASNPIAIGTPLPPDPTPTPEITNFVGRLNLIIPVAGVRPEQLIDTFDDAQDFLALYPEIAEVIDKDGDGIACEDYFLGN